MSNDLAIAAVTQTLVTLLGKSDINVTSKTPDHAAQDVGNGQRINLFLYHTMPNPAWRNRDIPGQVRPGERGNPPLALNLYYLLTAYGEDGNDLADQRILGRAMQVLHDRPVLKANDVRQATRGVRFLDDSDLHEQVEHVRIVPDTLTIEEMSRLWTTFQTQYRVSAAYQAAVVLIESRRPTRSALPVARRGKHDRGVYADVGVDAVLEGIEYRADSVSPKMPSASVGSTILLNGSNLPAVGVKAVVRDPKIETSATDSDTNIVASLDVEVETTSKTLKVVLDRDKGVWPAGVLSMELQYPKQVDPGDQKTFSTNAVPLAMAPQIQVNDLGEGAIAFVSQQDDRRILQLNMQHPLGTKRSVLLILNRDTRGSVAVTTTTDSSQTFFQLPQLPDPTGLGNLNPSFDVTKVPAGKYWVRIRVDGVDSMVMKLGEDDKGRPSVEFDNNQRVEI